MTDSSKFATLESDERAVRREHPEDADNFRTQFRRDYTRILHSKAFRRLRHKTQIFVAPRNDHICSRLEHCLYVSSIALTIAQELRLNEDLVCAIAIGHDIGHAPFGHRGEECLNKLFRCDSEESFTHETHGLRIVDHLESPYNEHVGLNLTFAVRDGIVCHYGEGFEQEIAPDRDRLEKPLEGIVRGKTNPATLEGCVVRLADKIAYLGRDLEDAVDEKIIMNGEIPDIVKEELGDNNKLIIANLIGDVIENSRGKDRIAISEARHDVLGVFNEFNIEKIYKSPQVTRHFDQVKKSMGHMFEEIKSLVAEAKAEGIKVLDNRADVLDTLKDFLVNDVRVWKERPDSRLAVDFIAGMTDSWFISAYDELFLPKGYEKKHGPVPN